ncbi:MAG: Asp-tRNA(Asn)/Glu-tRNA(Gln) amidotransferase subunit GatC [Chloroflexi bacterium]|nr:Asp-tRNA(Asn)/Glu-tRNA(Gln) amidotransferase subunit GatC [Chloroflexota bacterium]
MKLSHEKVKHIAILARLGLSEEETEKFRGQLSDILENFAVLQEVDTTDIQPTSQVTGMRNVTSADEITPSLPQNKILENAPRTENGFFKIKAVLE